MIPKRLDTLLKAIPMMDKQVVPPTERSGLNPFLIPIARSKESKGNGGVLCYIRWPTQKDDMDLQLVETTEAGGIVLKAMTTDQYLVRQAAELDYIGHPFAGELIDMINSGEEKPLYESGDCQSLFKTGKFRAETEEEKRVVLDKWLLLKVGHFPDCYFRIANNFIDTNNEVSAMVICERAMGAFYGWGHALYIFSKILQRIPGREKEAKDAAKTAMSMPSWTIAQSREELEKCATTAGFTSLKILSEMHDFRASDPREKDVAEGLNPIQVTLDQAAHLMDAVAFGKNDFSWDLERDNIAQKYRDGGYPEMADFIQST